MYRLNTLFDVSDITPTTMEEIVETIRSKEMFDLIQEVRVWGKQDEKRQKEAKMRLPLFTLCKVDGRLDTDHFVGTKYLIYDVDNLGLAGEGGHTVTPEKAKEIVDRFALFSFISPRGRGIKFVIELDTFCKKVDYRENHTHYADLLAAETGLDLDRNYTSLHTFFSYDKDCSLNENRVLFKTLTAKVIADKDDVDPVSVATEEIKDVCDYLSNQKLSYHEYTACAFALQGVEGGREMFIRIGKGDTSPDHAHRDWAKKFDNCKSPKRVNIATLFWVAMERGYKRKNVYIAEGRGKYNPFQVLNDGMYYALKDKVPSRIFGFRSIKVLYDTFDPINGNRKTLKIDGKEITVKATAFSSASEFRKAIQSTVPGSPFMLTNNKASVYYDMLFNYLDKTKTGMTVINLPGVGQVGNGIWNFGTAVCVKGDIRPYDQLIVHDGQGYALDDVRSMVAVNDNPRVLLAKLRLLYDFYNDVAATALGWAVSNIFYKEILSECGGFPILFLHGKSSSGKSKLANIILAMFGVKQPETSMFRLSLASGATSTAMTRAKDGSVGIPQFFDEYGMNRDGKSREQHFQVLKGLFDGVGKTMARKTNDNQVHRMDIGSGSIFASVDKENREEAINRCVYIDMNGIKDTSEGAILRFQKEFMSPRGLSELSSFALQMVYSLSYNEWLKEYRKMIGYLSSACKADSRVITNWAIVGAGYELIRPLMGERKQTDREWWGIMADITSSLVEEADTVQQFLTHIYTLAVNENHTFITYENSEYEGWIILQFNTTIAYVEVMKMERTILGNIGASRREITKMLKEMQPVFIEGKEVYPYMGDRTITRTTPDGCRATQRCHRVLFKEVN